VAIDKKENAPKRAISFQKSRRKLEIKYSAGHLI
jgi:hypothetical protein